MTEPNQGTRKAGCMLRSNGRREEWAIEGPLLGVLMDFPLDPRDRETLLAADFSNRWGGYMERSRDRVRTWHRTQGGIRYEADSEHSAKCVWHTSAAGNRRRPISGRGTRGRCAFGSGRPLAVRCQEPTQPIPPACISGSPRARYFARGAKTTTGACLADLCSRGARSARLVAGSNRADARLVISAHQREDAEPHTSFRSMIGGIPPGGLHGAEV